MPPLATLAAAARLYTEGHYEASRDLLLTLRELLPYDSRIVGMLATVTIRLGTPEKAFSYFQESLKLSPNNAQTHFELGEWHLSQGNYETGFAEYEWRMNLSGCVARHFYRGFRRWEGEPLHDASTALMVHCEQGRGDSIQFIRLLPLIREQVDTVYLGSHRELRALFSDLEEIAGVVTEDDPLPPYTHHIPLLSVPHALGLTRESIPKQTPYLKTDTLPDPQRIGPRIGLFWRTRIDVPQGRYKSLSLPQFLPLADLPVDWVSLQTGTEEAERHLLREAFRARDAGTGLGDFKETAAEIGQLDLLISIDTATAHLSGALNVPTWVLLPKWADWRWRLERETTPWYPSMTLFWQETDGAWESPILGLKKHFETWLASWYARRANS